MFQNFCMRLIFSHPVQQQLNNTHLIGCFLFLILSFHEPCQCSCTFPINHLHSILPSGSVSRENSTKIVCILLCVVPTTVEALSHCELCITCIRINQGNSCCSQERLCLLHCNIVDTVRFCSLGWIFF